MSEFLPVEISAQAARACTVIERHLAGTLRAIHLFGSAVDGGIKPHSDIDLLATVSVPPEESVRRGLMLDLLTVSAPPRDSGHLRPLEVTVLAQTEVVPWRYPTRRELQFGEWLRNDLLAGTFEPPVLDHDLAILLTTARQHSLPLTGPPALSLFDPVPRDDFNKALSDTIAQWKSEPDWTGDERNIVLTLARVWYSAASGQIASKDMAAAWALERLPAEHRPVLGNARAAYLGLNEDHLASCLEQTTAFVHYAKAEIERLLLSGNISNTG